VNYNYVNIYLDPSHLHIWSCLFFKFPARCKNGWSSTTSVIY